MVARGSTLPDCPGHLAAPLIPPSRSQPWASGCNAYGHSSNRFAFPASLPFPTIRQQQRILSEKGLMFLSVTPTQSNRPGETSSNSYHSQSPIRRISIRALFHHSGLDGFAFCCPQPAGCLSNLAQTIALVCQLTLALRVSICQNSVWILT